VRRVLSAVLCALAVPAACDSGDDEATPRSPGTAARPAGNGRVEPGEIRATGLREHLLALQEIAEENGGNRAATCVGCRAQSARESRLT
jgi:hypothetical protein